MTTSSRHPQSPYCSNCGYDLSNLTESSKCPECGRPLVEVLTRGPAVLQAGKRYRSQATLFGLPVIDIAIGPKEGELRGKARGVIAIGDIATGWLAIGGIARGLVAIGGLAFGGFSVGGLSVGLLMALGGGALGGFATGGGAVGIIANGGAAAGIVAQGGGAAGYFARGGSTWGSHVISMQPRVSDPRAIEVFNELSWLLGPWPPSQLRMVTPFVLPIGIAVFIALIAMIAMRSEPDG